MSFQLSRRKLVTGVCSAAVVSVAGVPSMARAQMGSARGLSKGMKQEGPDTPKIGAPVAGGRTITDTALREVKQLGVNHVLMGGPKFPWSYEDIQAIVDRCKSGGLAVGNMMIAGFPNVIYGKPGRDAEIEQFKSSIVAAGKAGVPVVEYNFYAHRAMEGYYLVEGRGGSGLTGFDIARMTDQRPLPNEGAHSLDEMWSNIKLLPEGGDSDVREGERAAGAASERSADPSEPRVGADHGIAGGVEEADLDCGQPVERDHV